jgi:hypothetical protein
MSTTAELPTAAASPSWTRRVIAFPLTRILLGTVAVVAAAMAPEAIIHSWVAKPYRGLWPEILAAAVALLAYRWIVRRFGRREATELAHSRAVPELAAGIGLGFVLVGGVIAVLAATGAYQLQHVSPWSFAIIKPLGEMVLAGTLEELVFAASCFASPNARSAPGPRWRYRPSCSRLHTFRAAAPRPCWPSAPSWWRACCSPPPT